MCVRAHRHGLFYVCGVCHAVHVFVRARDIKRQQRQQCHNTEVFADDPLTAPGAPQTRLVQCVAVVRASYLVSWGGGGGGGECWGRGRSPPVVMDG